MATVRTVRDRRQSRTEDGDEERAPSLAPAVDGTARSDEDAVKEQVVVELGEEEEAWWSGRAAAVRAWLQANPLEIGVPADGCLALIRSQLERGDMAAGDGAVRRKCWRHIEIEMKGLPGWDAANSMPDRTFLRPSQLRRIQQPPQTPPHLATSPPPAPVPAAVPGLPLSIAVRIDDEHFSDPGDKEGGAQPFPGLLFVVHMFVTVTIAHAAPGKCIAAVPFMPSCRRPRPWGWG